MAEKLVTEPHNPFLLETFRAFLAESQNPALAAQMTMAHVEHASAQALTRIANSLDKLVPFTDPVVLGQFLAVLKAQEVKRTENRGRHLAEEAEDKFEHIFRGAAIDLNATDEELAS